MKKSRLALTAVAVLFAMGPCLRAQEPAPLPAAPVPVAASPASISGTITDTSNGSIPGAKIQLEDAEGRPLRELVSEVTGAFSFEAVPPGSYILKIKAAGFAPWRIKDVLILHDAELLQLPVIELGVEAINTTVDAITMEDLAEQQISAEEKQRILGILPNFFVSYLPNAAPLTNRQKFKLAAVVSVDPLTFFTTGVNAGIEQSQNSFSGYGQGFAGYARRYGAGYGDRLSSTFLGAAILPSLFHQDPRYFYRGHGHIVVRALYAMSTVVICKGDNGKWQPNYSNVLGNLGAAGISASYYPHSDQHSVQVTVSNTLIGIGEGSISTLFQEFLLRHLTKGVPKGTP